MAYFRSKSTVSYYFQVGNVSLHVTESGYRCGKILLVESGFWSLEYGIQLKESGIPPTNGIRIQFPLTKNRDPFSTWNPESKTVFDFLTKVETFSTRKGPKVKLYLQFHVGLTHIIRLKANRKTFHEQDY